MPGPIRPASIDDLPAVERIVHDGYVKYISRMGKNPRPMLDDYRQRIRAHEIWVTLDNNVVVGVLVLLPESDHLLLDNVAVDPAFHGRGIGRILIEFAEREANRRGYDEIRLYTHQTMHENIAMYLRRGYEETGRFRQDGFERVFFRKGNNRNIPVIAGSRGLSWC
jgi:ribosomal protein S18 acetylase RimI-like enzyme